ncbi:inositol monophosphatase family protein [Oleidesulfovibrio sp.]|uniref:inositol monophosphatase family protein n=1 Tax=Oleidesulfovibrio sp. TaxID=2909707 RepID=UPI003A863EE9
MKDSYKALCDAALNVVTSAGMIMAEHWSKPRNIRLKGRIDLVTQTDVALELALKNGLSKVLPEATYLAEETASDGCLGEWTWVIDPLDGTTNFAHGLPFVASSVALWHKNKIVAGVVHNPILQESFWAVRGGGAWRKQGQSEALALHVSETAILQDALVSTGFPYSVAEDSAEVLSWLKQALERSRGVRRYGAAALDLAYLAAGHYDVFYEIGLKPWDTAAGWLLIEEAGGHITSFDGVSAYHLGDRGILATNGQLHSIAAAGLFGS